MMAILFYFLIITIVFGGIYYIVGEVPAAGPFVRIVRIVLVLIYLVIVLYLLFAMLPAMPPFPSHGR